MTGDKQPSRRDFLRTTATTGAAVGLGSLVLQRRIMRQEVRIGGHAACGGAA